MTGTEDGAKPPGSGYALIDWRLEKIERQLADGFSQMVPLNLYTVHQKVITDRFAELMKTDSTEQTARGDDVRALHKRLDEYEGKQEQDRIAIDKNRKQFWLTVAAGGLVAILSFVGNPISVYLSTLMAHK